MNKELFYYRHIGSSESEIKEMLEELGCQSLDALTNSIIPEGIQIKSLGLPKAISEHDAMRRVNELGKKNKLYTNFIGQGYYNSFLPELIKRNILENPEWYTSYTPYQAEISQGRLEALINFQTLITELTAMEVANASLLDEGTACAEAMMMAKRISDKKNTDKKKIFIDASVFPTSIDVIKTRAKPLEIEVVVGNYETYIPTEDYFACLLQSPNQNGSVIDIEELDKKLANSDTLLIVATDLAFLCLAKAPGEYNADIVVGSSQRFGLPLSFGGPHSAFIASKKKYIREMPGRIIGVSKDVDGNIAYRMMLQTREQHIKRDRATSNICTAQVLLAILSSFYAIYHQKQGLIEIAKTIYNKTSVVKKILQNASYSIITKNVFDTIHILVNKETYKNILERAEAKKINLFFQTKGNDYIVGFSIDETHTVDNLVDVLSVFDVPDRNTEEVEKMLLSSNVSFPSSITREKSTFLNQPIFNFPKSETELVRYIKHLESKDFSLCDGMIPLGSCTMKLNSTSEMLPLSNPRFSNIHPHAPSPQVKGYMKMIEELGSFLKKITQFSGVTFQPNSGASGEYAGLLMIRQYHLSQKQYQRKKILIPVSAHGTNPASAVMCGFDVVIIPCDNHGNISYEDVKENCLKLNNNLAGMMITYPSTHGIFEDNITMITSCIHEHGGLVYMDGANLNAQVGLTSSHAIGADVCHINLHKTFSIPHGGGGPGMGPVLVNEKLLPFLPNHSIFQTNKNKHSCGAISSAPFGSASILLISYMYIIMLGEEGCKKSSQIAILNANYMAQKLKRHFPILYVGKDEKVGHEFILDLGEYKKTADINAIDIAKRIIDFNFHPPTVAFPVAGTIMIEPTESESKVELDRFCEALMTIREEIKEVEEGKYSTSDNVLKKSPFTINKIVSSDWTFSFTREKATFPVSRLATRKKWASISRIDDAYGDRNIFCVCPDVSSFQEDTIG